MDTVHDELQTPACGRSRRQMEHEAMQRVFGEAPGDQAGRPQGDHRRGPQALHGQFHQIARPEPTAHGLRGQLEDAAGTDGPRAEHVSGTHVIERPATDRLHPNVVAQLRLVTGTDTVRLYDVPVPLWR